MKKLLIACLSLAFSSFLMAQSQSTPSNDQSSQSSTSNSASSSPTSATSGQSQSMSGKVSSNGKNFTEDKTNQSHSVNNPDSLKDYENQHVIVLVHEDPDTGNVTITAVQPPQ